jgi:hypothetical protein
MDIAITRRKTLGRRDMMMMNVGSLKHIEIPGPSIHLRPQSVTRVSEQSTRE